MTEDDINNQLLTKEMIALQLATSIAAAEGIDDQNPNYRKLILDLYGECLESTSGNRIIDAN